MLAVSLPMFSLFFLQMVALSANCRNNCIFKVWFCFEAKIVSLKIFIQYCMPVVIDCKAQKRPHLDLTKHRARSLTL